MSCAKTSLHTWIQADGKPRRSLDGFQALAACGGFSYGDVLGAGSGWAKSILMNAGIADQFEAFFHRPDTLALGVCNGCQMLSQLTDLIPGAEHWPRFVRNRSEQFEARFSMVEVMPSHSVLLKALEGAYLPIVVSHGEGRAALSDAAAQQLAVNQQIAMRFVGNDGAPTQRYPANPEWFTRRLNGGGILGWSSYGHDAASRAILPRRSMVLATARLG